MTASTPDVVRLALVELRLNAVEGLVESEHKMLAEIRVDIHANKSSIRDLAILYESDAERRKEACESLARIEMYITKEVTTNDINKKHITLAASVIGGALTLLAGVLLFVGDVIAKFWRGS